MGASKSLISSVLLDEPAASGAVVTAYDTEGDLPSTNTEGAYVSVSGVVYRWSDAVSWYVPSDWYSESLALLQDDQSNDLSITLSSNITNLAAAGWNLTNVANLSGGGITLDNAGGVQSRAAFGETPRSMTVPSRVGLILEIDQTGQVASTLRPELRLRDGTNRVQMTFNQGDTLNALGFLQGTGGNTANTGEIGAVTCASFGTVYADLYLSGSSAVCKVQTIGASGAVYVPVSALDADATADALILFTSSTAGEVLDVKRLQAVDLT